MNFKILRFDSLTSTNTEAAEHARRGVDEGLCVIARQQTDGRGRLGRSWFSEKDSGLYFSIVLRPKLESRSLPLVTLMTGVAVHDALQDLGLDPDIKWVNDILIGERKISGILAETVETPDGTAVVVGIGINLSVAGFPDELSLTATSMEAELGRAVTADEAVDALTRHFSYFYSKLTEDSGTAEIIECWRERSSYCSGKHVRVTTNDSVIEGVTDGLEENGALRVRSRDGSLTVVHAGDVEKIRTA